MMYHHLSIRGVGREEGDDALKRTLTRHKGVDGEARDYVDGNDSENRGGGGGEDDETRWEKRADDDMMVYYQSLRALFSDFRAWS